MPLTYNRNGHTAADLNNFFTVAKQQISSLLPYNVRLNPDGVLFDDLSLDETDAIAAEINNYEDILKALQFLGTSERGLSLGWEKAPDASEDDPWYLNLFQTDNEDSNEAGIARKFEEGQQLILETAGKEKEQFVSKFFWSEQANKEIPLLKPFNANFIGQVVLTSGGTVIECKASESKTGAGWYGDGFYGRENFSEDYGYDAWALQKAANNRVTFSRQNSTPDTVINNLTVGTTYTMMYLGSDADKTSNGINDWVLPKQYGFCEEFNWVDFPEGKSPSTGTATCNQKTEDLSSQVNGENTAFTTTDEFEKDCLHLFWNGQRLREGVEYNVTGSKTFTTTFTPDAGSVIFVDLVKKK